MALRPNSGFHSRENPSRLGYIPYIGLSLYQNVYSIMTFTITITSHYTYHMHTRIHLQKCEILYIHCLNAPYCDIARVLEAGALKQTSSAAEAAAVSEVDVQATAVPMGSGDLRWRMDGMMGV